MNRFKTIIPSTVIHFCFTLVLLGTISCENSTSKIEDKNTERKAAKKEVEKPKTNVILCFGNSLTEAQGVTPEESYPNLIQNRIDSLGLNYQVVNAGLSGETTSGGKGRLNWVLKKNVKIFILELGANDGLRGIPLTETEINLQEMIDTVRAKVPEAKIILAGMQIPPNLGIEYTKNFKNLFPSLAKKNNIELIPFLLEGVAGIPELNQADGIHPTPAGHKVVLENVWNTLVTILKID